ncbi:MAG: glycosyltransferase family 4 protein [Vicinamibacterales bacterium]
MPNNPRTLLLIPSVAKHGVEQDVLANLHPTMDYFALQSRLDADLADYSTMEADPHPLVKAARLAGRDGGLAAHGFVRAKDYDVIFSNGENVSVPLAALLKCLRHRPGHVFIGHRLSAPKKRLLLRVLRPQMDAIFVYSATQQAYAQSVLGISPSQIHLIAFHADTRFYHPMPEIPVERRIASAGLELRDYPTLIEAVRGLDVEVRLAAASPWSKRKNETADRELPPNVSARGYSYRELRELYASSRFVVVPLYETDFQAGVTTILEAMAMGKAVIVSSTRGQRDVIQDGVNGLYVPPGDVAALRAAITGLLGSPERAAQLGANARRTLETQMSLDLWADRIADVVRQAANRP